MSGAPAPDIYVDARTGAVAVRAVVTFLRAVATSRARRSSERLRSRRGLRSPRRADFHAFRRRQPNWAVACLALRRRPRRQEPLDDAGEPAAGDAARRDAAGQRPGRPEHAVRAVPEG